jgi:cell division protein FtsB
MIRFMTSRPSSRTVGRAPLKLRQLVLPLVLLAMIGGLSYQALQGNRGLQGWQDLRAERQVKSAYLDRLETENTALQARAQKLSGDSLDLDYLDERVRVVLGLVGRDDTIIYRRFPDIN